MSKEWEDLLHFVYAFKHPREVSDHNPLILTTVGNQCKQNKEFRFGLACIKHEDFMQILQRI
jgi:hypothetical protein